MRKTSRRSGTVDLTDDKDCESAQHHRTRLHSRNGDSWRKKAVLSYPPGEIDAVTLTMEDVDRLNPGEFLNDSLIDLHCRWTSKQMAPHVAKRFHIFSSFLYAKLAQDLPTSDAEADAVKWSKGVDVFAKDYLLIPICQKLHWSLAVVCFPRLESELLEPPDGRSGHQAYQLPCILHFSSIRKNLPAVFKKIRAFLQHCWDVHHKDNPRQFEAQNLRGYNPLCPQQPNEWDCGIYVLEFIKRLCLDSPEPTLAELRTLSDKSTFFDRRSWFKPIDLERSRDRFRELVESMQEDAMQEDVMHMQLQQAQSQSASAKRAREDDECVEVEVIDSHSHHVPAGAAPSPQAGSSPPHHAKRHRQEVAFHDDVDGWAARDALQDVQEMPIGSEEAFSAASEPLSQVDADRLLAEKLEEEEEEQCAAEEALEEDKANAFEAACSSNTAHRHLLIDGDDSDSPEIQVVENDAEVDLCDGDASRHASSLNRDGPGPDRATGSSSGASRMGPAGRAALARADAAVRAASDSALPEEDASAEMGPPLATRGSCTPL